MTEIKEEDFYSTLPLSHTSVSDLLGDENAFHTIPEQWHVIIVDVKNSTGAIENNLHDLVNLTATGSIIAVLNIARNANIGIPFFFGGDGGTLLIPPSLLSPVMTALEEHKKNTKNTFGLELWLGNVPVSQIVNAGYQFKIARIKLGQKFIIPLVLGNGLKFAESLVKNRSLKPALYESNTATLNLQGMECRWDKIKPPPNTNEVVCLLIEARKEDEQAKVFKKALDLIEEAYGSLQDRRPISLPKLELDTSLKKIQKEMKVKVRSWNPIYLIRTWLFTLMGHYYFKFNKKSQEYLKSLIEFSDTLVFDGRISTVISGTAEQRIQLITALDQLEEEGEIVYGHHLSSNSIMSCYVRDRKDQHIHFVDGSDGGYTRAAVQLKKKLKREKPE